MELEARKQKCGTGVGKSDEASLPENPSPTLECVRLRQGFP